MDREHLKGYLYSIPERFLRSLTRMAVTLGVNRKRIQRLMRTLGIEALYPKPNLSRPVKRPGLLDR